MTTPVSQNSLALIRPEAAAGLLGFDTTNPGWRVPFWRFCQNSRLPYVRLSARRFRFRPETIQQFIARRETGSVR